MFESSVISDPKMNWRSMLASATIYAFLVGVSILVPLIWTDSLSVGILSADVLSTPPPPPAGPTIVHIPKGKSPTSPQRPNGFFQPTEIPKVDPRKFGDLDSTLGDTTVGIPGGVPGGVPGGCVGCLGNTPFVPDIKVAAPPPPPPPPVAPPPPPPPPPAPQAPTRVGGEVAQANLISQVRPVYPPLARVARVSGVVLLQATISKEGTIQDLKIISSASTLLNDAAIEAVKQWRYKPQLLNGQPIEVITTITVNFSFAQ